MTIEIDGGDGFDESRNIPRTLFPLSQFVYLNPCRGRQCLIKAACTSWCEDRARHQNFKDYMWEVWNSIGGVSIYRDSPSIMIFIRFALEILLVLTAGVMVAWGVVWGIGYVFMAIIK
jgi:hypothetical protein